MQSQEELLSRAALPLPGLDDDSGPIAPDFEPRLTEAPTPQPTPIDTRPRIDRAHQLSAAQPQTLRKQSTPGSAPEEAVESAEDVAADLQDPLQRLMEATAVEASRQDDGSFENAEAWQALPGPEDSKEPGPGTPQPVELAPLESVEADLNELLRPRMEAATAKLVFPESEVTAPAEAPGDHDAIVARLMEATADDQPASSDLLEGVDEATADEGEFGDVLEHDVLEPAEASPRPRAAGSDFSMQELLDGLGAPKPPETRRHTVRINELGEGTLDFSDELMPSTPPAERAWDDAVQGSGGAAELLEAWGRHKPATPRYEVAPARADRLNIVDCRKPLGIVTPADRASSLSNRGAQWMSVEPCFSEMAASVAERMERLAAIEAVGATAPSLALSVPNFDPRPVRHTGPNVWTSPMNETPDFVEVGEAAGGSWQPEGFSTTPTPPSTPSRAVVVPDPGTVAAGSTSAAYALHVADWASSRSRAATLGFADGCEVAPIAAGQELISPSAGCRVPGFTPDPVPSEDRHQGIRLFGLVSCATPEAAEGERAVPPHSEDMIAASCECRTPEVRIEGLASEYRHRGITLADMVWWVNPETVGQQGLPVFANWTGGAEQPRPDIGVPLALSTGAIRSVRQFPRFGCLLKSAAGAALMQGLGSGDASGVLPVLALPVLALNEQANQPQPFSVMQLESHETDLEAIGPAAAVYAPANLEPL